MEIRPLPIDGNRSLLDEVRWLEWEVRGSLGGWICTEAAATYVFIKKLFAGCDCIKPADWMISRQYIS